MDVERIPGATRNFGAPKDWNPERDGPCGVLPIRDEACDRGMHWMVSQYKPSPEDLAVLNAGGSIRLGINGTTHPVIHIPYVVPAGAD